MKLKAPFNLIHISIESLPTCALCDSGSSVSLISQQFYQRLLKKHDRLKSFNSTPNAANLYAANNSKLKVKTTVDLTVRLQGITIINSFIVVDELAYNVILGADFLHDTRASMNFGDRRLILYDGLVSIPLSDTNEGQTAYTVSNVIVPPCSQAIFFVAGDRKVPPGTCTLKRHAQLPTEALMVANTVVKTQGPLMSCSALNTTDKPIRFRKHTPIVTVAPVLDVESTQQMPSPLEIDKNGTIQDGIESTPGPVTLDMSEPQSQAPTTAAVSTPPTEYTLLTFHHQSSETCVAAVTPPTLPSLADFREALPKCNDFRDMFAYLSSSKLPRNNNVARRILLDAQNYTLEDGVLYRHYKPRTRKRKHLLGTIKQLCVPTALRPKIVIAFHDGFTCHAGVDRTFETIRSRYWFPGCYAFIKQHVITCLECQQAKQPVHKPQVPILPLGTPQINSIFVADHHGPLVESDGKKYVLTIVDETSLWVELVAVASCDAQTFVNAFFDHVIARHGCPYGIVLRTDNGSAFISQVSKAFCESFGIKQVFSSPYHHTSIARAEQSFATVNNALKILCKDQRHWSRHLQAIAMGLRCTASSVSALSPFEIQFGRKMPLAIDIALMNEPPRIPSVEYYVADIKPKLAILNEIAMQCSAENAARHREVKNQKAVTPTFKLGDKVLVTNEAVAPNQSKKLIKRFAGPFFITSMENGFTYKLKHVMTGKELRRPVHASRLIAYKELENCYRLTQARSKPCLFVEHTSFRKIRVKVIVGDLVSIQTHAIVNQTDEFLTNNSGLAHQLAVAAGEEMNDECAKYITEHGRLPKTQPVCTTAGALAPSVKTIIHIVGLNAAEFQSDQLTLIRLLKASYYACLSTADSRNDIESIALPILGVGKLGIDVWTSAHAALSAVVEFDKATQVKPGSLRLIKFVTLNLTNADIMATVSRQLLPNTDSGMSPKTNEQTNQQMRITPDTPPTASAETTAPDKGSTWYRITKILKHRRRKGQDEYLVCWASKHKPSWVKRANITDYALQKFYAEGGCETQPRRRGRPARQH
jgi:O-acetyl-ADP-ribose deacetylase (regulator of RNase III)